jgi:hypothetical protein
MRHRLREVERSLLAASSIIVIFGAATLIGTHFSADVAAYLTRYAGHEDMHITEQESRLASKGSRKSNSVAQRQVEPDQASAPAQAQQAQVQQVAAVSVPEAQQSLMEDRAEGLAQEPAEARRATEGLDVQLQAEAAKSARSLEEAREKAAGLAQEVAARNELAASTEQHRQTLAEGRDRSAALASELATAQWNAETRVVQSNKTANEAAQLKAAVSVAFSETQRERERAEALASELAKLRREAEAAAAVSSQKNDEAVQQKQTAESTITELRQSLQQEQKKSATLMQEAKAAQAMTASAEQQRRALEEARARAAALASELAGTRREMESWDVQSRKAEDAAAQQKQAAEREIAELRQSLQQEPDRAEAMARDFASARRPIDERVTVQRAVEGPIVPVTQPVAATVTEPPDVREKAEAARLLARAGSLIARGNIGAARVVLERTGESGNARANFMLAETYDPAILLAWGTYGTRGDAAKARELYTKAHAGGIQEAKERLSALRQ